MAYTVQDSVFTRNAAQGLGGAILVASDSTARILDTTFSNNFATVSVLVLLAWRFRCSDV